MKINMHNNKRKTAIDKVKSLKGGKEFLAAEGETVPTYMLMRVLRRKGYIYESHKFVKVYGEKK